jgi:hypothetical protein
VLRYFKRTWNEPRGDSYDGWGTSVWYFELDEARNPVRQIEMYESGDLLAYDGTQLDDEYGGLGDQALEGEDEWKPVEITEDEFEAAWRSVKPRNR